MNNTRAYPSFISYWLGSGLESYMEILKNIFIFTFHFFSIPYLITTLFAPWKRAYRTRESPGFSFEVVFDSITFNLVSRSIGAIIRFTTILFGLFLLFLLSILGIFYILLWFFWIPLPIIAYSKFRDTHNMRRVHLAQTDRDVWREFMLSPFGLFLTQRLELTGSPHLSSLQRTLTLSEDSYASLILVWFDSYPEIRKFFDTFQIQKDDLMFLSHWWNTLQNKPGIFSLETLLRIPSIGKTWTYGYTPTLERFTSELSHLPVPYTHVLGRTKEIRSIEETLMRRETKHVFLIGEPGVGKHPLLIYLAHEIASGRVFSELEAKRMVSLEMEQLFEEHTDSTARKATVSRVLQEAERAGNIILVVEDFDRYVSTGKDHEDISDVFLHALARGNISLIAAVTPDNFHQYIRPNTQLIKYFESIPIHPATARETRDILADIVSVFETHGLVFTYQSLIEIIRLSEQYLPDKVFPEKAIMFMEHIETSCEITTKPTFVTPSMVQKMFEKKEGIPVQVSNSEAEKLLNIDHLLHSRIIGQDKAIDAISTALKRARTHVGAKQNRPMGTFLFLGPTGVGKTETAKALADLFFNGEHRLLRVDMNEYTTPQSVNEILGDPNTGNVGTFLPRVREMKYGVILLDEFEKADAQVKQLFLSLLDEGYITDAFGKTVSFLTTIIIATSNAGTEYIREHVHDNNALSEQSVLEYLQRQGIFSPELLNRFDSVVVFTPLSREQTQDIVTLVLTKLFIQVKQQYGVTLGLTPQTREKLLHEGFSTDYGGRALYRAIQHIVENPLSEMALRGELKRGQEIVI